MPQSPLERVKSILNLYKKLLKVSEMERRRKNLSQYKFCRMISCEKYFSLETKRERCRELRMCFKFSSLKYLSNKCPSKKYGHSIPCRKCGNRTHITALCYSGYSHMTSGSFTDSHTSHSVIAEISWLAEATFLLMQLLLHHKIFFRPSLLQ